MIPKIIWQTYECDFELLPEEAKECSQTWIKLNPNWEYRYMNAKQREEFILKVFGSKWFDIYSACPLKVMKANVWRYLVVYAYGGLYADLDTICKKPIDQWVDGEYSMIVTEDEIKTQVSLVTFACVSKHPALKNVLLNLINKFNSPDFSQENIVHNLTGEGLWTESISGYLDSSNNVYYFKGADAENFNNNIVYHYGSNKKWNNDEHHLWVKK